MGADRFFVQGGLGVGLDEEAPNNLQQTAFFRLRREILRVTKRKIVNISRLTNQENVA